MAIVDVAASHVDCVCVCVTLGHSGNIWKKDPGPVSAPGLWRYSPSSGERALSWRLTKGNAKETPQGRSKVYFKTWYQTNLSRIQPSSQDDTQKGLWWKSRWINASTHRYLYNMYIYIYILIICLPWTLGIGISRTSPLWPPFPPFRLLAPENFKGFSGDARDGWKQRGSSGWSTE